MKNGSNKSGGNNENHNVKVFSSTNNLLVNLTSSLCTYIQHITVAFSTWVSYSVHSDHICVNTLYFHILVQRVCLVTLVFSVSCCFDSTTTSPLEHNLKLEHDINSIACTTVTSSLIVQYFDELELMVIVLFVMGDIDRNLKRKMQIILFDAKTVGEYDFGAMNNDFNYMDLDSFDSMINQIYCSFGTPLPQQQTQAQEQQTSGQQKRIIKKIQYEEQEKAYNQNPKVLITSQAYPFGDKFNDFSIVIYKHFMHVHAIMKVVAFLYFFYFFHSTIMGLQSNNHHFYHLLQQHLIMKRTKRKLIIFTRYNL